MGACTCDLWLADQFVANDHDLKWLFETVALTDAYQRQSRQRRSPGETPFAASCYQRLRGDQLFAALVQVLEISEQALGGGGPAGRFGAGAGGPFGLGGPHRKTQKIIRALLTGYLLYALSGDKTYRDFADPDVQLPRTLPIGEEAAALTPEEKFVV